MECNSKTIIHSKDCHKDDKSRIKQEHSTQDEKSIESQKYYLQPNQMFIEEYIWSSDVDTKIGIKQETWEPNVVISDTKSDPEEPLIGIGPGAIKGFDEIYIKEDPLWCEGAATDPLNEEKESESYKHEASGDTLLLESPRLPSKAAYPDYCSDTFLNVEKGSTSEPACERSINHGNSISQNLCSLKTNAAFDRDLQSEKNKGAWNTQLYGCDICEKSYTHKSSLKTHKLLHLGIKPYRCDLCVKCYTRKSSLQTHILLHSGAKSYKCDTCEKCFTYKSDLQRHKLLHSGIKPYKCDVCEKCFTQKSTLQGHILLHVGTKAYKCDICEKCFKQKSELKRHSLCHSSTKPYKCGICEKGFTQKSHLRTHDLLHSGIKAYKCDTCKKCFTQKSTLQGHKLLHSGIKAYKCVICESCFTQKSSLKRHKLLHFATKPCI